MEWKKEGGDGGQGKLKGEMLREKEIKREKKNKQTTGKREGKIQKKK